MRLSFAGVSEVRAMGLPAENRDAQRLRLVVDNTIGRSSLIRALASGRRPHSTEAMAPQGDPAAAPGPPCHELAAFGAILAPVIASA